jgi:DNA-binding ferritin-like protein
MTDSGAFAPKPDHPGVSPTETPPDDATFVIWQDPSSYNPFFHGPPYLPGMKVRMDKSASVKSAQDVATKLAQGPGFSLPTALAFLRALSMIHQSHHWLTHGDTYYADHLLFERLYNETVEEVDQVAERAVGLGCPLDKILPTVQAAIVHHIVKLFCEGETIGEPSVAHSYVESSLKAEKSFLKCLSIIVHEMKEHGELTRGTDNLIAGIEDKHESHVYLLQQRLTADPWKA